MKIFENEFTTVVGKEGFTLAETLITVAILGVVAAITIPAIINHQTESANRTKLKKAMTTYEKALNQMIIENDLKTNDAIADFGEDGGNCKNTTEYFKKVEGDGCRFKTADRIWWDITDIENPVISLKDEITEDNAATMKTNAKSLDSDRTSFAMIGRLDDTTGVLRINDKGAETTTPNKEYMTKLYNFMNKVENAAAGGGGDDNGDDEQEVSTFWQKCTDSTEGKCTYTYACDAGTCTADMTKVTFENKCVTIVNVCGLADSIESCPMESEDFEATLDAAVVVLPDTNGMNWNDAKQACDDAGLEMANAAQVQQLYNSEKPKSTLENLCDGCSSDNWAYYWVSDESSNNPDRAYFFANFFGGFLGDDTKDGNLNDVNGYDTHVVCVGK